MKNKKIGNENKMSAGGFETEFTSANTKPKSKVGNQEMNATHALVIAGNAEGEMYKVIGQYQNSFTCIDEISGGKHPFFIPTNEVKVISEQDYNWVVEALDDDGLFTKRMNDLRNRKDNGIPIVARMGDIELELGRVIMPKGPGDVCHYNWNNSETKFQFDFDASNPTGYNEDGMAQLTLVGWYATDFDQHVFIFNGYDEGGDLKSYILDTSEEEYTSRNPMWVVKELDKKSNTIDAFCNAIKN